MPYSPTVETPASYTTSSVLTNGYPGGSSTQNVDHSAVGLYDLRWSRSGTNTASVRSAPKGRARGYYVQVTKLVRGGPRIAYRVPGPKGKTKVRYKRGFIEVVRLKWVRSPREPKPKVLYLKPNALSYQSSQLVFSGSQLATAESNYSGWYRRIDGNPCLVQSCFGSTLSSPNPTNYLGNTWSQRAQGVIQRLESSGISSVRERVKNQKINLAQALAERRQTIQTVVDTAVRVASVIAKAKKGNLLGAARTLFPQDSKQLANDVLVFQYGIRPLLADLQGAVDHLTKPEPLEWDVRVRKKAELEPVVDVYQSTYGASVKTTVTHFGSVEVTYKVRLRANPGPFREFNRLGLTNLLSLGWELIPFSFVADWFLPIGDYLNSLDAFLGVEIVSAHKTVVSKETYHFQREFGGRDVDNYLWAKSESSFTNNIVNVHRSVLNAADFAPPLPSFKDPVSSEHLVNAMALLRQLRR